MPKPFVHPRMIRDGVTLVLRNGASIRLPSTVMRDPKFLTEDITNHPAWTGKKAEISADSVQMLKYTGRFGGFESGGAVNQEGAVIQEENGKERKE